MPIDHDERTEPATPRRRQEARQKGQVARSHDLSAALLLLTGFVTLRYMGPGLWNCLVTIMAAALAPHQPVEIGEIRRFSEAMLLEVAMRLGPLLVLLVAVVLLTLLLQVGLLFTWQPLTPSLGKLNPIAGFQRLFSTRSTVLAIINFGKLAVVGFIAYLGVMNGADAIIYAASLSLQNVIQMGASLSMELGINLSVALVVLALLDYGWQRYRHERDLRMTREEVKDELRSMEGDPAIKRRRRQLQLQLALQRLRRDVPKADVVVTNPTHYAVAIRYDADTMVAPKVITKGADYVALRIRQLAKELGIPVVEKKSLARALFESVEVGQYVPERFYQAIAEILAYIYELSGRSRVARP